MRGNLLNFDDLRFKLYQEYVRRKVIETIISKLEVITTDQCKKLRFCG